MLLVGHGSKLPYNKDLVLSVGDLIAEKSDDYIVRCAFMNMNTPSIKEALESFSNEDIVNIVVVPLFLAKGVHILKDIPELINLPEGQTKGTLQLNGKTIPLVYADPIGSDPLLADLMLKNAKVALSAL